MKGGARNQSKDGSLRDKHCWQRRAEFKTANRYQNWCSASCEKDYQKTPIDYPASQLFSERLDSSVRTLDTETNRDGSHFTPFGATLGDAFQEVRRRLELRERIEVERGMPISDEEFLRIADATGIKL